MSEEDSPSYKDGDIVWVKLGSSWWPGEVTETGPEDLNVKKPPLVIVRFFNEGTYKFVNNYTQIYPYNCERKDDFIKKGMDSFRANNAHMEKFPVDVSFAEVKTNGNPNILSDPKFLPQKKSNVIAEIFGSPTAKKTPKDGKSKGRGSTSKNSSKKPKINITHRRFLGFDDYEARIRVQFPGKDTEHLDAEDITPVPKEPAPPTFPCSLCPFQTNRLEVMVFHVQCHNKNIQTTSPTKKKTSPKKKANRKPRTPKHITSEDDKANSSSGLFDTDTDEDVKPKPKRKRKSGAAKESKQRKINKDNTFTDIRTDLLAEWSDSDDNETMSESKHNTSGDGSERMQSEDDGDKTNSKDKETKQKDSNKSCFDFDDEEEEEDNSLVHTAVGRKIPRVIPPNDKRKSSDPDNEDASLPIAEDDENRMELLKETEKINENAAGAAEPEKVDDTEFKKLLETATVPEIPDLPELPKFQQQNFQNSKTIKIPDKKSENSEVATKLTNPKKRFVKSFEDFELLQNEQRKAQEEKEKIEEPKKLEENKEIDLKEKLNEEEIKENDVVEKEEEKNTIEEKKEKKDGRKSKRLEKAKLNEKVEEELPITSESSNLSELTEKSADEEKNKVESDKSEDENKTSEESGLKISKLKCQLMSKMVDDESSDSVKSSPSRAKPHRSPRSKILENYRNDKSNEKKSSKKEEIITEKEKEKEKDVPSTSSKRSKHATRKSKFLKYQESEEDDKIEEEIPTQKETKPLRSTRKSNTADEEITKQVDPIDDFILNDFLFDFEKKPDGKKTESELSEEEQKTEDKIEEAKEVQSKPEEKTGNLHEVTLKCASNDNENSSDIDMSIKTNLTNLNKTEDEMSALTTLAMVSELENLDKSRSVEIEPVIESLAEVRKNAIEEHFANKMDTELVAIDGNLTVVSEKELADAQVEITADISPNSKKPVTLTSFSMDFSESNSTDKLLTDEITEGSKTEPEKVEKIDEPHGKSEIVDEEKPIVEEKKVEKIEPEPIVEKIEPIVEKLSKIETPAKTVQQTPSKLLERLTHTKVATATAAASEAKQKETVQIKSVKVPASLISKDSVKTPTGRTKFVIKSTHTKVVKNLSGTPNTTSNKPVILSEKIIKPETVGSDAPGVSVQKITSKRIMHDADEIDTFIIQKGAKKTQEDDDINDVGEGGAPWKRYKKTIEPKKAIQIAAPAATASSSPLIKKKGKAKILQQTIITPAGEIIQPGVPQNASPVDDFDINSMPIVLSDEILTPESIENMPIFLSDSATPEKVTPKVQPTIVKKMPQHQTTQMRVLNKSIGSTNLIGTPTEKTKLIKTPKVLSSSSSSSSSTPIGQKIIKQNSFSAGKHGKFVIVSQPSTGTPTSKYTVGKKQTIIKRSVGDVGLGTSSSKVQNVTGTPEPSGNKIMILTNQQGQQQRVLLTPAQQKMMGYQNQGNKLTKTVIKGNVVQKKDVSMSGVAGSSGLITKTISSGRVNSNQHLITSTGQILTPIHQGKSVRIEKTLPSGRKLQVQSQKVSINKPQKTILIKNQHGQTVRKIQGTDDALLDQQVAEQLEAIKASGVLQQKQEVLNFRSTTKPIRRSYAKKPIIDSPKPLIKNQQIGNSSGVKTETAVPPLAPISPKKTETVVQDKGEAKPDRPLNQLVIQDALGNQTTITEGQILALPSETIDGQPQSYMLVTLDESGNLTPLNNEALMSLDPNLGLGGDLGNTVLQIDQGALKEDQPETSKVAETVPTTTAPQEIISSPVQNEPEIAKTEPVEVPPQEQTPLQSANVTGDSGQQLIVTGDPIAAQKFLESLTEGNTDLANILASAEGSSILIHADGQQILINTDSENQMLLSVNNDNLGGESSEGDGNPIFANQPSKNQDILAAALADTDVFQQDQNGSQNKVAQLSPNSALYPMNVGNVLETSLTLNSPIMTPLEVPSTNNKKISDESDILNQVPKNVDLPITITDPNISQTVSQQQVATMMANELENMELAISDSSIAATSEMNSPNFVYSLPNLEGDINQKPFNSSMPLLTEDAEEVTKEEVKLDEATTTTTTTTETKTSEDKDKLPTSTPFLVDENEGLCSLGNEMCSSLSEPPPDMFDLSAVLSADQDKPTVEDDKKDGGGGGGGDESASSESVNTMNTETTSSPNTVNEDSCEIPVQPEIVANLEEGGDGFAVGANKRGCSNDENAADDIESKKCKFD